MVALREFIRICGDIALTQWEIQPLYLSKAQWSKLFQTIEDKDFKGVCVFAACTGMLLGEITRKCVLAQFVIPRVPKASLREKRESK